ncbi:MAG: bifunctional UDP-N-acetylmuramoyl-tripeptide:D-alanyl-D-alanine ligase/alanine racemase, partial [Bacteroidota bacterium]|nr:bifunctional UDP-N-acetylmuramoyl-tripeptide:D-alanyl-D-alanine ligase/alanine racemase [Bacteroidota bacterium]MDX5430090.1 bifunctional UDP-N-acetylmuramoyl-tripeptide:D-alanyl-D-alanine ligase/alanine racemase [Bacteroidota bacterium]MDX5468854.1 bifunctional UDP-N-acetylmuramoyl-tripeptide:D-alanyl-D-alanine ligase/alanine racemase [Bacteroidota bacterium]
MAQSLASICTSLDPNWNKSVPDRIIRHLSFDSRRIVEPEHTLFFALGGQRDGHDFLDEAHQAGVRAFVVKEYRALPPLPESTIISCEEPLEALHRLAGMHRDHLNFPILGITGSNGKTVVKEWLYHLLHRTMNIGRSPKSYNSQIGLPLSVWQLEKDLDLGIIEAGISKTGEMQHLASILHPEHGLFTSIGDAHQEGFLSKADKIQEKLRLFHQTQLLVYPHDDRALRTEIQSWSKQRAIRLISWGQEADSDLQIIRKETEEGMLLEGPDFSIEVPFKDFASLDNACSCIAYLKAIALNPQDFADAFHTLPAIDMRMQLLSGRFNSRIINDAYSADLS